MSEAIVTNYAQQLVGAKAQQVLNIIKFNMNNLPEGNS